MKKMTVLFLSLLMIFTLAACGNQNNGNSVVSQSGKEGEQKQTEVPNETSTEAPDEASTEDSTQAPAEEPETTEGKTLVVYFSATGNTEEAAGYIAAATGADMFELEPVEPYSDDDLNWTDDNSRVVQEHDNPDAREVELVESTVSDWDSYDTIFIGFAGGIIGLN